MSRLIDEDEVIRRIRMMWVETDEPIEEAWRNSEYAFGLYDAIGAVEDTPDAIVQCRDCKHMYRTMFCGNIYYNCGKRTEHVEPDGYCDGGERE